MARTTTAGSSVLDSSVVTEIQKPAGSIKRTTTEVTEVLPAPSEAERVGGRDLEAFLDELRESEWGNYSYYLYRLNARTMQNELQKARPGDSYLSKIEAEDYYAALHDGWVGFQEWVKGKFGGGWFRLRVNSRKSAGDGTAANGGTRTRCANEFSIEGDPRYSAKEISSGITGHSGSSDQGGALLPLVKDLLEQVKRGSADPAVALKEAMQMAASMNNQFVEMFKTQIPQQSSPEDQLTKLVKAIETLGYTRPGAAAAEASVAVNPLASTRETLQMLKEFGLIGRELEPAEEKTFAEQLREALEVAKLVTPPASGGKMSGWDALAQVLPSMIEKGLPVIRDMWDRAIQAKMAGVGAAPAPASPGPTIIPQERTAVVVAGASEAIPNPPPATADTQSAVLNWLSSKLIEFVQLGVPPEDVAHWLGMSDPKTCSLLAALGREKVLEFIAGHPILKVLKDDPRLPKFVDGFLEALKPETDEEDDSQPGGKPN